MVVLYMAPDEQSTAGGTAAGTILLLECRERRVEQVGVAALGGSIDETGLEAVPGQLVSLHRCESGGRKRLDEVVVHVAAEVRRVVGVHRRDQARVQQLAE